MMKVTILGCATSTGVPIVGCTCETCKSDNPKNKRTRCSVLVQTHGKNILIDTSTDLRFQALRHNITNIDAVLYTHSHADHTHGIDELRTYYFFNRSMIPCFGNDLTITNIEQSFHYIFDGIKSSGGKPKLEMIRVNSEFALGDVKIIPVEISHATWKILGYRIGTMAYLTDCSAIPEESLAKLQGLELLILSALRYRPHAAHFNVEQAVRAVGGIKPKLAVFTHMGHELEYDKLLSELPDSIVPAYDGLEIDLPEA